MSTLPSTTEILKAAGLYADLERFGDPESMRRGRLVDAACNLLVMGKELPQAWETDHLECVPFIDGYRSFLQRHTVNLIECAFEVVNKAERYLGHPDQLIMLDGVRALIDIKTGGMQPTTSLQTASYEMAMYSMGMPRVTRFGLQLARGDFKLHPFIDPRDKDEFIILARAHWIRRKYLGDAA
jgi:hypothetical protein